MPSAIKTRIFSIISSLLAIGAVGGLIVLAVRIYLYWLLRASVQIRHV